MDQLIFASLDYAAKEEAAPSVMCSWLRWLRWCSWVALEAVIEPHYPLRLVRMAGGGLFHWP